MKAEREHRGHGSQFRALWEKHRWPIIALLMLASVHCALCIFTSNISVVHLPSYAQGCKRVLFRIGRKKFGAPNGAAQQAIDRITEPAVLEMLSERMLEVRNWDELLDAVPG